MGNVKCCLTLVFACLLLLSSYTGTGVSAGKVSVLEQNIRSVTAVSAGRFFKIAWSVKVRNETPEPQTCIIRLSFLDSNERVVDKTTKSAELKGRETKTVTGTVQLRASAARQIVSTDVAVEIGEENQAKTN